jgi:hypothetical protein
MAMTPTQAFASKTDPTRGCELRHATTMFDELRFTFTLPRERLGLNGGASDITIDNRYYAMLEVRWLIQTGKDGALNPHEHNLLLSLRTMVLENLLVKLRDGILIARGFRPGEIEMSELPALWWNACSKARVDLRDNSAEANGTRLTGIWVYPAEAMARHASAGAPKKISLDKATREYLKAFPERATKAESEAWGEANGYGKGAGRKLFNAHRNGHETGRPRKNAV